MASGLISSRRERQLIAELMKNLQVKAAGPGVAAQTLSGGNQQKLVVGKWLGHLGLAIAYLLMMSAGILIAVRGVAGFVPAGVAQAVPLLMLEITLSLTVSVAASV